jgi:hypothetical protein
MNVAEKTRLPVESFRTLLKQHRNLQTLLLDMIHECGFTSLNIDAQDARQALVTRIDCQVRKQGRMNVVETGRQLDLRGTRNRLGKGCELVEGSL